MQGSVGISRCNPGAGVPQRAEAAVSKPQHWLEVSWALCPSSLAAQLLRSDKVGLIQKAVAADCSR